jgi:hypothetical protein
MSFSRPILWYHSHADPIWLTVPLKSWMSWTKLILMAMSAFLYSTSKQYVTAVYLDYQSVCPFVSLAGEGAGGANSDEERMPGTLSTLWCLLSKICLAPVGQTGRHQLRSVCTVHFLSIGKKRGSS